MKKLFVSLLIFTAAFNAQAIDNSSPTDVESQQMKEIILRMMLPPSDPKSDCRLEFYRSWERVRFIEEKFDLSNYANLKLSYKGTLVWMKHSVYVGGSYGANPLGEDVVRANLLQILLNSKDSAIRNELIQQLKTFNCL